jgi:hypothetical protein
VRPSHWPLRPRARIIATFFTDIDTTLAARQGIVRDAAPVEEADLYLLVLMDLAAVSPLVCPRTDLVQTSARFAISQAVPITEALRAQLREDRHRGEDVLLI